jgi:hypothetical protein
MKDLNTYLSNHTSLAYLNPFLNPDNPKDLDFLNNQSLAEMNAARAKTLWREQRDFISRLHDLQERNSAAQNRIIQASIQDLENHLTKSLSLLLRQVEESKEIHSKTNEKLDVLTEIESISDREKERIAFLEQGTKFLNLTMIRSESRSSILKDAIHCFNSSLALNSFDYWSHFCLACIYKNEVEFRDDVKAQIHFEKAFDGASADVVSANRKILASLQVESGWQASDVRNLIAESAEQIADINYRKGELPAAIDWQKCAINFRPRSLSRLLLARYYSSSGQAKEALLISEQIIEAEPLLYEDVLIQIDIRRDNSVYQALLDRRIVALDHLNQLINQVNLGSCLVARKVAKRLESKCNRLVYSDLLNAQHEIKNVIDDVQFIEKEVNKEYRVACKRTMRLIEYASQTRNLVLNSNIDFEMFTALLDYPVAFTTSELHDAIFDLQSELARVVSLFEEIGNETLESRVVMLLEFQKVDSANEVLRRINSDFLSLGESVRKRKQLEDERIEVENLKPGFYLEGKNTASRASLGCLITTVLLAVLMSANYFIAKKSSILDLCWVVVLSGLCALSMKVKSQKQLRDEYIKVKSIRLKKIMADINAFHKKYELFAEFVSTIDTLRLGYRNLVVPDDKVVMKNFRSMQDFPWSMHKK